MLLDATKLARELGVSTWVPRAAKIAAETYGDPTHGPLVDRDVLHAVAASGSSE